MINLETVLLQRASEHDGRVCLGLMACHFGTAQPLEEVPSSQSLTPCVSRCLVTTKLRLFCVCSVQSTRDRCLLPKSAATAGLPDVVALCV